MHVRAAANDGSSAARSHSIDRITYEESSVDFCPGIPVRHQPGHVQRSAAERPVTVTGIAHNVWCVDQPHRADQSEAVGIPAAPCFLLFFRVPLITIIPVPPERVWNLNIVPLFLCALPLFSHAVFAQTPQAASLARLAACGLTVELPPAFAIAQSASETREYTNRRPSAMNLIGVLRAESI